MSPPGGSSSGDDGERPFRVLPGGRGPSGSPLDDDIGIELVEAPLRRAPFRVDARVVEEDTWKVLSAPPPVVPASEHPIRVMNRAWAAEPEILASVHVEAGDPLRLVAIVYDLDADPICTPETVATVLEQILDRVDEHEVEALALPRLGAAHGRFPSRRFDELLAGSLQRMKPSTLCRIWLVQSERELG